MSRYTLEVQIDHTQYPILKQSHYKLCIARMVNQMYTTVWSSSDFLQHNMFQWTDEYEVFGQESFAIGAPVVASTDPQHITYGQTCVMTADGELEPATGAPDQSGIFSFRNQFGAVHVGVSGRLGNKFLPIYVSPTVVVAGDVQLEPSNNVKVWFELHLMTGSMILDTQSSSIVVLYEGTESQKVGYGGDKPGLGSWSLMEADSA